MNRTVAGLSLVVVVFAGCGDTGTAVLDAPVEVPAADTVASLVLPEASFALASPQQAAAILDDRLGASDFVLLDVRTPEEYSEGHITGSANVDFYAPEFADSIAALDRDKEYVVYCRSGNRSGQTLELMRQLGFTNVTDVAGGIVEWQAAGLPLEG